MNNFLIPSWHYVNLFGIKRVLIKAKKSNNNGKRKFLKESEKE